MIQCSQNGPSGLDCMQPYECSIDLVYMVTNTLRCRPTLTIYEHDIIIRIVSQAKSSLARLLGLACPCTWSDGGVKVKSIAIS